MYENKNLSTKWKICRSVTTAKHIHATCLQYAPHENMFNSYQDKFTYRKTNYTMKLSNSVENVRNEFHIILYML